MIILELVDHSVSQSSFSTHPFFSLSLAFARQFLVSFEHDPHILSFGSVITFDISISIVFTIYELMVSHRSGDDSQSTLRLHWWCRALVVGFTTGPVVCSPSSISRGIPDSSLPSSCSLHFFQSLLSGSRSRTFPVSMLITLTQPFREEKPHLCQVPSHDTPTLQGHLQTLVLKSHEFES